MSADDRAAAVQLLREERDRVAAELARQQRLLAEQRAADAAKGGAPR